MYNIPAAIEKALNISAYTCLYRPLVIEELLQCLGVGKLLNG